MEEKQKRKPIFIILILAVLVIILLGITIVTLNKNTMTPEETLSRFMYLIENKDYEEAKKLTNGTLEKLEVLSQIKPSELTFDFSEDKRKATSKLLEKELETTNIYVNLTNNLLGWKIDDYEVITEPINPQEIENKMEHNETVSSTQFLYWGSSKLATKDKIAKYAENNIQVATLFINAISNGDWKKVKDIYVPPFDFSLSIEDLKELDWNDYEVLEAYEPSYGTYNVILQFSSKKIVIRVYNKEISNVGEIKI